MTTDYTDEEIAEYCGRLVAVLGGLHQAVEKVIELTAALPYELLNLESLASESVTAAWRIRARILEAYAAIVILEGKTPRLATDVDGTAALWPPAPADLIWRTVEASGERPSDR